MEAASKYPLQRKWSIWEMWNQNARSSAQNFKDNMTMVSSFDNLHSFWQHWLHLPYSDPQSFFFDVESGHYRLIDQRQIEAIGIFEDTVMPAWEDQVNSRGCDIAIRLKMHASQLKERWDSLVFSTIGETFPHSQCITGVRIVDKTKSSYKFEVWLRVADNPTTEVMEIKRHLFATVFGGTQPEAEFKVSNHSLPEKRHKH
mmetsp:Transcript_25603/g.44710  ORF Transcript_25603/g.44710 Transcript_25603/m.44710 type:complete len:201 (+) Transcript_25603:5133-5735(+)